MSVILCWVIEGEVLLGEQEREVPPQGEAEGKAPLGEQEPFTAESDHVLSFIFGWQRPGHN